MTRFSRMFFFVSLILASDAWAQSNRKVTAEDMPRIPHTPADKALETFRIAKGCKLELVAAEPMVADPVDACFDEFGRMFVAEMHGYPFSQEPTRLNPKGGGKEDAGIIRLLEDTDGDGRMDKSTVFADKISWPTSVCCFDGGVFALAPQYLYYFKDTDGDDKADVREVVLDGFGRDNVQSLANNLKWGLDNKIYFAAGRNPRKLLHRGNPLFPMPAADLRFDPKTEKFEIVTGGVQFGRSMDDWGNWFVCSNSNHIQQVIFPRRYLSRNLYLAASGSIRSIAADGSAARVFRTSPPEPWRIIRQKWRAEAKGYKLVINDDGAWEFLPLDPSKKKGAVPTEYPVGYFTSATGVTIYRGGAYPAEFQGNAFMGDVGGNLVHRKTLKQNGVAFTASRADEGEEFIASSDNWFRPVNFINAPDGTLYVLDMYRETVEHPYSIPEEIKKFLHLQSGSDRGRIYRIVTPAMKRIRPPRLGDLPTQELVRQLESDNAWNRETAQRLLWQRQDKRAVVPLTKLARESEQPQARIHALYTLDGLGTLFLSHIANAVMDSHPRVREHAARLSERLSGEVNGVFGPLSRLCDDEDDRVRLQLAFSLGEMRDGRLIETLARVAGDPRNSGEIRTALLSSVAGNADQLVVHLAEDQDFVKQPHAASLLSSLSLIVGSNPNNAGALNLLATTTSDDVADSLRSVMLSGLGEGLKRRGSSVVQLLADDKTSKEARQQVIALFDRAARAASDKDSTIARRTAAIGLLAFSTRPLRHFLTPQNPQAIQRAAVAAIGQQETQHVARTLLDGWKYYTPQVRRDVVDVLMTSANRINELLSDVEKKKVGRGDIERDKKQLLLKHPNVDIWAKSEKLFAGDLNSDRARVVAKFQTVLDLEGDVKRGQAAFQKRCSVCHQVGGVGHKVAPDLTSVQNKSPADLLIAILDPNREAQPNFNTYNVLTADGRIYNGIIAAEASGSITLRRAEAKEDVVLRSNIDSMTATGISLMPEGFEKDLSAQDFADLISFVKSIKPSGK